VRTSQRLSWSLVVIFAAVCAAPSGARGGDATQIGEAGVDRMIFLNKKAFSDLRSQHFQAAKYWLEEALVISETAGLEKDEMTARTHVHLAAVYMTGLKDRDEAVEQFLKALAINPNISITPGLETPALRSAYLQARERAGLPPNPDPTAEASSQETFAHDPSEKAVGGMPAQAASPANQTEASFLAGIPDPDLPARVPVPLYCEFPFEIPEGKDIVVRCLTQKLPRKSSASIHYRTEGNRDEYTPLPLERSPKGWLVGVVPGTAVRGRALAYYAKAHVPGQRDAIFLGRPEAPNISIIKRRPLAEVDGEGVPGSAQRPEDGAARMVRRRAPGSVWLAVGVGTGAVYHGHEPVDSLARVPDGDAVVTANRGFSRAGLVQLEPQVGYQWTRRWSVSLLARYQYAPKDQGDAKPKPGESDIRTSALAAFAQAQFMFANWSSTALYATGGAGVGTSFLAIVDRHCDASSCMLNHSDTLHGGALGLSAGLGAVYFPSNRVGVFAEVKEIATLPKTLALTELNVGFVISMPARRSARR
jgi:hypothetical protein